MTRSITHTWCLALVPSRGPRQSSSPLPQPPNLVLLRAICITYRIVASSCVGATTRLPCHGEGASSAPVPPTRMTYGVRNVLQSQPPSCEVIAPGKYQPLRHLREVDSMVDPPKCSHLGHHLWRLITLSLMRCMHAYLPCRAALNWTSRSSNACRSGAVAGNKARACSAVVTARA